MAARWTVHTHAVGVTPGPDLALARQVQGAWARTTMRQRLRVLRRFRGELAAGAYDLAATVPLQRAGSLYRSTADTLIAEVLPLAEACRFLEREASYVLRTRREGTRNRPAWLRGVEVEIERAPLGVVLIIGPANYTLFLPGAQALQALAAGNAVLWKPAPGGEACAHAVRVLLLASGLPAELLTVLGSAPAAAQQAIEAGVDKVLLTGSAATGEAVQHALAAKATPAVMELSGCDAVFVLEGADIGRIVQALAFGLRLNGSATCMAPRRVFVATTLQRELTDRLVAALAQLPAQPLPAASLGLLRELMLEASLDGARTIVDGLAAANGANHTVTATLMGDVLPRMRIAQTDIFAPVLSLLHFSSLQQAVVMYHECPYALTASIFGPESEARKLAGELKAGVVLLNDIIVPTADPRAPFGGRGRSGFGVTRGREGLLEMTAPKTVLRQRGRGTRAYQPTREQHAGFFAGFIRAIHGAGWRSRLQGLRALGKAAPALRQDEKMQRLEQQPEEKQKASKDSNAQG